MDFDASKVLIGDFRYHSLRLIRILLRSPCDTLAVYSGRNWNEAASRKEGDDRGHAPIA
jgi:hypothetical protein